MTIHLYGKVIVMNSLEWIGIVASILICISMCFKSTTYKGAICMRSINILGSIIFGIYGILLPAISTAVLNFILVGVNIYYLIKLIRDNKKNS